MKKRMEVRSQLEFDACVEAGNIAIVIGCSVVARGSSSVVARGSSSVEAWGSSSVEARDSSSVVAWDSSSVVARGNVFVRVWSALRVSASARVAIMIHGSADVVQGGQQLAAAPEPTTGAEYCDFHGIDRAASFVVPNIDAAILAAIESDQSQGLDMTGWHGQTCDETNWCKTTHCRAGYAICLAGKAGFDLERKFGSLTAGQMIYAVSRPDQPLPDFYASDEDAIEDIKRCAGINAFWHR